MESMKRAIEVSGTGFLVGGALFYTQALFLGLFYYFEGKLPMREEPKLLSMVILILFAVGGGALVLGGLMLCVAITFVWPLSVMIDRFNPSQPVYTVIGGFLGVMVCLGLLYFSGLSLFFEGLYILTPLTCAFTAGAVTGFRLGAPRRSTDL